MEPPIHIDGPVGGDVFTGGKIVINTGGGDYYEAAPTGITALHQLPSPRADFTGRAAELAELRQAIREQGASLCGLRGLGGVGKTALALVLAHELAPDFPDAQIFVDLQGVTRPLEPPAVMAHVIRAYKPVEKLPDDPAQLAAVYRSLLHGQRALLLLDNASEAQQIKPLIPPPGCLLLVTSRAHFALPGLRALNLDTLPPADAQALLLRLAPRIGDQAAALAGLCAGLPLALTLAGSALAERDDLEPADYARRLQAERGRLGILKEVEASLALSYDLLTPELRRLWCMLSVFPADFDAPAAAAIWSLEPDLAKDRLGDLLRLSLLDYDKESRRYRLHDLARDFAHPRLSDGEHESASRRHAEHFKAVLAQANRLYLDSGQKTLLGLALFDLERASILAGQAWAAAHAPEADQAARLASDYPESGAFMLALRLSPRERAAWIESALAAARRLRDRSAESAHLGNLGNAYSALGEPRRAIECHEQALAIDRDGGYRRGEGADLTNLGNAYAALGDLRRAIEYHEQALPVVRAIRAASTEHLAEWTAARRAEGAVLTNLGNAYAVLGETRRAVEYYEQSLELKRGLGDRHGEGNTLGNLGNAYADLGEPRRAIEYYERQLTLAREFGDRRGEGNASGNLGLTYADLGEPHRAIECYERQLTIAREIGDRRGEGAALGNLGLASTARGEPRQAIEYYQQALAIHRETGDRRGEGAVLGDLGLAFAALGEPRQAIEHYQQALAIDREIGDRLGEAADLGNLGNAHAVLGEPRQAVSYLEQQLAIAREIGDRRGEARTLWNRALVLKLLDDQAAAIADAEAALKIREQIEDPDVEMVRRKLAEWKS